jgi:uncharacterized protein with ParB-like and HNH nuclease domain
MKIAELIFKRVNKDYLLPSIQREFVWLRNAQEQKIEKLFDSILQGYPFGSVLVWEVDKPVESRIIQWEVYEFVGDYDKDNPHNKTANINGYTKIFLVLDGQQRLSSLNVGLRGSYSYTSYGKRKKSKLYLNLLSEIEDDPDNSYGFKYEFKFFAELPEDGNQLWFEVGRVLDYREKNTELFKEDYDSFIRQNTGDPDKVIKAKMILGELHQSLCINDNLIITPIVGDDEKALNVFVRTNDGGIKLEKADLLLSYMESNKEIFLPAGARKEIFDFVDLLNKENLHKPDYDISKDDVLKAALVLSGLDVQYKLKNFNSENLKIISDNWGATKTYFNLTISLIARYGFSSKNIVSKNALIPIAYYLMKKQKSKSYLASQANTDLKEKNEIIKWLVMSQLRGAFGGSSDSTLKSVRDLINSDKTLEYINLGRIIKREDVEKWVERECYGSKYSHLLLLLVTANKYWDDCHLDHIYPASKFNIDEYMEIELTPEKILF